MSEALVILCTCPDEAVAEALAHGLVSARLAACVNVLPRIRSIYRWQDAVENEFEVLLLIKTTREGFAGVEQWLEAHHPYEVPEVVALPAGPVAAPYLAWIEGNVNPGAKT